MTTSALPTVLAIAKNRRKAQALVWIKKKIGRIWLLWSNRKMREGNSKIKTY